MTRKFDLPGDPIPDTHGKPGADGHRPAAQNISKVRDLPAAGVDRKDIAVELGITVPTLTKHYFGSGRVSVRAARRKARADLRAQPMLKLGEQIDKGNVSARSATTRANRRWNDREGVGQSPGRARRGPAGATQILRELRNE